MKKTYTIGRDPQCCDILIYDSTDVVSRSHATLRVDGRKYYITDHSTNGTYRNGIRLTPYQEYRITKDDDISFGNVARLDWSAVDTSKGMCNTILWITVSVLAALLIGFGTYYLVNNREPVEPPVTEPDCRDTTCVNAGDTTEKSPSVKQDVKTKEAVAVGKDSEESPASTKEKKNTNRKRKNIKSNPALSNSYENKDEASSFDSM